jgi:crotonobetainyl-CoA:carnitine CoA-transferase CaiB-like acyl-CoA transferase
VGPLEGIRVVELAHEHVAWAGKLLADLGADVILVEPRGGSPQRMYEPFLDDVPGPERSLWWWHYHTSKRGVVADLTADADRLGALVTGADVLLEAEPPGALAEVGLDWESLRQVAPQLVMVTVTPFGSSSPRSHEPVTDLTVLAESGPVWSCGYDDHSLPPVRGGGNQAFHTGGNWATLGLLVALLARQETGTGQHVDVSLHAASNVTTEMASYGWLMCNWEVQRQTGRHAAPMVTPPTQVRCADGRYATTGVPPRSLQAFASVLALLDRLGLREEFPSSAVLELGAERETFNLADIETDPLVAEILHASRDVVWFLAEHMDAYEFFVETQRIGLATGVIATPGEAIADQHFVARGFPVEIDHPELGRAFTYPGAPYRFTATPWAARRAPLLGEHQDLL